ncbi:GNAT family N-acetyltransferase [Streptomyces sp. E11-3]|uniref:GNAT family N-acetyltransferase n=1 Tax=Streptomyces sp. E11-3 TaxID=3110112 RepID=UPI00397F5EE4
MSDQRCEVSAGEVVVRRAGLADAEGFVASSSALFAEDAGTRDPTVDVGWPREYGPQRFAAGLDDPDRLLLVADRDGEVVGHLAGAVADGSAMRPVKVATLVGMYVRPAYRRDQIGGRLVDEFLRWAESVGAGLAEVTAYASNGQAIQFYERNGFGPQAVTLRTPLGARISP